MSISGFNRGDVRFALLYLRIMFRDRFIGSSLGVIWAIASPVFLLGIFTFVFGFVFRAKLPGAETSLSYVIWLISGYGPWLSISEGISSSAGVIIANAPTVQWLVIPFVVLLLFILIIGIGFFVSVIAVFVEAEILLLDETLSTGDQWFQKKATKALHALCARGKIVIVVSHGMTAIQEICNRCVWLRDGKLIDDGDVFELTAAYPEYQRRRVDDVESRVLITGDPCRVDFELELGDPLQDPAFNFNIERVDGLLVLDQSLPARLSSQLGLEGNIVAANIDTLLVGPGLYKCEAELTEKRKPVARRSIVFKIHSDDLYTGGRPVLHYPISITAKPAP